MQGRYTELLLIALCLALPVRVSAAEDGPLLCVPIEEVECVHTGECKSNVYESMNIPQFIKVDLTEKSLSGTWQGGTAEVTPIQHVTRIDGRTILQGTERGRGWSMVIVAETGKMTLTVSDNEVAFLAFGACLPLATWLPEG